MIPYFTPHFHDKSTLWREEMSYSFGKGYLKIGRSSPNLPHLEGRWPIKEAWVLWIFCTVFASLVELHILLSLSTFIHLEMDTGSSTSTINLPIAFGMVPNSMGGWWGAAAHPHHKVRLEQVYQHYPQTLIGLGSLSAEQQSRVCKRLGKVIITLRDNTLALTSEKEVSNLLSTVEKLPRNGLNVDWLELKDRKSTRLNSSH